MILLAKKETRHLFLLARSRTCTPSSWESKIINHLGIRYELTIAAVLTIATFNGSTGLKQSISWWRCRIHENWFPPWRRSIAIVGIPISRVHITFTFIGKIPYTKFALSGTTILERSSNDIVSRVLVVVTITVLKESNVIKKWMILMMMILLNYPST